MPKWKTYRDSRKGYQRVFWSEQKIFSLDTNILRAARGALCSEVCVSVLWQVYWIFNQRSESEQGGYQRGQGVETARFPEGEEGTKLCPFWSGQKMSIFVGHEWTFCPRAARGALCSEVCVSFLWQVYWIFNQRSESEQGGTKGDKARKPSSFPKGVPKGVHSGVDKKCPFSLGTNGHFGREQRGVHCAARSA